MDAGFELPVIATEILGEDVRRRTRNSDMQGGWFSEPVTRNPPTHLGGSRAPACPIPSGCIHLRDRGRPAMLGCAGMRLPGSMANSGSRLGGILRDRVNGLHERTRLLMIAPSSQGFRDLLVDL